MLARMTSGSPFRGLMTLRCIVQRVPDGAPADTWGHQDASAKPATIRDDLPCYAWHDDDARDLHDGRKNAIVGAVRLIVPTDADVTVADRIVDIRDRRDRTVIAGPLEVLGVAAHGTHQEVLARQVRRGEG